MKDCTQINLGLIRTWASGSGLHNKRQQMRSDPALQAMPLHLPHGFIRHITEREMLSVYLSAAWGFAHHWAVICAKPLKNKTKKKQQQGN